MAPSVSPISRIVRAFVAFIALIACPILRAAPSPIGTGLKNNITLGALQDPSVVNRDVSFWTNYDVDLNSWRYDVYVPPGYDGTKPYGVVAYITSDPWPAVVLQAASNDRNIIWIAPRDAGNNADTGDRLGAALLALYRAKELFNIDPRRVYTSGKSGGARAASALAFFHSELIHGTAPSAGFCLPRLNSVSPDYITNSSGQSDTYFNYSNQYFSFPPNTATSFNATAKTNKLRSYIMGRYNDYREDYAVEAFHCAYEPQGQIGFLYNAPGEHTDPSNAEMVEAIDYLDRNDVFPVNANVTAGSNGFSGMSDISQSGASAASATNGSTTTYTLTPTLTAVAAAKSGSSFYWDNTNGSTVRWLWEVKNAAPTNQKTSFGLWFPGETWGGAAPVSLTAGNNPGILITITQNGSQNRMVVSARPDSGGETIFYDGNFSFVPAYSTAWTKTQTGYLTGTGSPVEIRMDLNQSRWQLTFNGIKLDGTRNSIATGTDVSRDNKRSIYGYWNAAIGGAAFWKHNVIAPAYNTWSPFTKSIFTASTGALSGTGAAPSPMELRYVIASDPGLADPLPVGPSGLTAVTNGGSINLTWNALNGATSYDIKRSSVSGGPYTTLQNVTSPNYTDSSAESGTVYYYTVSAVTASGTTANAEMEVAAGVSLPGGIWVGNGADGNWQTVANWTALPVVGNSLTFAGGRQLATNNFAAGTSFDGLTFSSGAPAFTLSGNAITLSGNVSNNSPNTQSINLPLTLATGAHSVTTSANGAISIGGVISGSGTLTKAGAGTLTLPSFNTYSGGTTVNAGTLVLAAGGGSGAIRGTVTVNSGATLKTTVTDAVGYDVGNQVSLLNLTGGTFDNGGTGNEGFRTNVALTGGAMTSTGGGSFLFTTGGYGITSLASSTTSTISSNLLLQNSVNLPINVADGPAATDLLISGVVNGSGSAITKTGAGTMTLSGANTFSGGVTLSAGKLTLGVGSAGAFGNITSSAVGTGTLTLAGGTLLMNSKTLSNALAITSSATIDEASNNGVLAGPISGSGDLTLRNTSGNDLSLQVTNGDWNGFTGTITYNGGQSNIHNLLFGSATALTWDLSHATLVAANTSNGVLSGGVANASLTIKIGTLSGSGILDSTFSGSTTNYEIGARGENSIFSGIFQNSVGTTTLTKTGVGTLTLTATNTYSGATTVNGGILNITGSLNSNSGAVAVNNGGTLAGTGTVARATTVASGGVISPGNGGSGVGTLTLSGGLTLNTGAALNMELGGTATSDKIAVSGTFSSSGTTLINLTTLVNFSGFGTYPIITGASGISASNFALGTTPSGFPCTLVANGSTLSVIVMTPLENWRFTNFGTIANTGNAADDADPDGDGMSNALEFTAGTNPNSSNSILRVSNIAISGNDIVVSFATVSGKNYHLERSTTLQAGSWITLQSNIVGNGGVMQITDVGSANQQKCFYRVVTP